MQILAFGAKRGYNKLKKFWRRSRYAYYRSRGEQPYPRGRLRRGGNLFPCLYPDRAAADLGLLQPHADAAVHALRRVRRAYHRRGSRVGRAAADACADGGARAYRGQPTQGAQPVERRQDRPQHPLGPAAAGRHRPRSRRCGRESEGKAALRHRGLRHGDNVYRARRERRSGRVRHHRRRGAFA